jgi:hypothetical protein
MSADEYDQLGISGVQGILRSQHIVVTGQPLSQLIFDEKGLGSIGLTKNPATIHGKSFFILVVCSS